MGCSQATNEEHLKSVRLPFCFGQTVFHRDWPEMEFFVVGQTVCADHSWSINVSDKGGGGYWIFPAHELKPGFVDDQAAMARWMGCSVETMNMDHDRLHELLADLVDMPSLSLQIARGESLSKEETALASLEEDAVLHLQKYVISRCRQDGSQARPSG
jgi:hypothetical protein